MTDDAGPWDQRIETVLTALTNLVQVVNAGKDYDVVARADRGVVDAANAVRTAFEPFDRHDRALTWTPVLDDWEAESPESTAYPRVVHTRTWFFVVDDRATFFDEASKLLGDEIGTGDDIDAVVNVLSDRELSWPDTLGLAEIGLRIDFETLDSYEVPPVDGRRESVGGPRHARARTVEPSQDLSAVRDALRELVTVVVASGADYAAVARADATLVRSLTALRGTLEEVDPYRRALTWVPPLVDAIADSPDGAGVARLVHSRTWCFAVEDRERFLTEGAVRAGEKRTRDTETDTLIHLISAREIRWPEDPLAYAERGLRLELETFDSYRLPPA